MTEENQNEKPESDLADDVKLEPSTTYPGKLAAVAYKDQIFVCWNCFEPLVDHADILMDQAIVRVCRSRDCISAVAAANRAKMGDRGRMIFVP